MELFSLGTKILVAVLFGRRNVFPGGRRLRLRLACKSHGYDAERLAGRQVVICIRGDRLLLFLCSLVLQFSCDFGERGNCRGFLAVGWTYWHKRQGNKPCAGCVLYVYSHRFSTGSRQRLLTG